MTGLIFLAVSGLLIGGILLYTEWRKRKAMAAWPKTWVHVGIPDDGFDVAMGVIAKYMPGMPQAGTIEWIDGPFLLDYGRKAAGALITTKPINIKLMKFKFIEQGALAHECVHAWSTLTGQGFGDSYGGEQAKYTDPKFVAFFTMINAEIKKALGR